MYNEIVENKNLYRLAELGLQTIADHHEIRRLLYQISCLAKDKKLPELEEMVKAMSRSLDSIKQIQYQKEKKEKKDVDVFDMVNKIKKWYCGDCTTLKMDINCINNFTLLYASFISG